MTAQCINWLCTAVLLLLLAVPCHAQPVTRLAHISNEQGLPSHVVNDIVQDQHGFMWFATAKGLSRYDGYQLNTYPLDEGDQLDVVSVLLMAADDTLWVGSKNKGLFVKQHGTFSKLPLIASAGHTSSITSLTEDHMGRIWVGSKAGLFIADNATMTALEATAFDDQWIVSMVQVDDHELMIATRDAVYLYDQQSKEKTLVPSTTTGKNRIVYADQSGGIWLGRDQGLFTYHQECGCFLPFNESLSQLKIQSLVRHNNELWIGTLYEGLYRYSTDSGQLHHHPFDERQRAGQLADANIMSLFIDDNDTLWMGTFRGGVNHFNLSSLAFGLNNHEHGLMSCASSLVTYDLVEQDHLLWVAPEKGLVRSNHHTNSCELFQIDQANTDTSRALLVDAHGRIWVGGAKLLYLFNPDTGGFQKTRTHRMGGSVLFLSEYSKHELLLGTINGLYLYDTTRDEVKAIESASAEHVRVPFNQHTINAAGQHIFATNAGAFVLSDQLTLQRLTEDPGIGPERIITAILADARGGLWLGTDYQRLLYADAQVQITDHTRFVYDQDIQVQGILAHLDELWISSNKGLFRYDPHAQQVTRYDVHDGLQDNEFLFTAHHQTAKGKIYFGGKKGFNGFFPAHIPHKLDNTVVNIARIQINGQALHAGDQTQAGYVLNSEINDLEQLLLNHKDSKLDIEFTAADYADPQQNRYAYRLRGFSDHWEYTSARNRQATYTNLGAGTYTFEVKAANKYGQWSADSKRLSLNILPAPWLSPWAYAIYVITSLLLVWSVVNYKIRAEKIKARKLEAIIDDRTREVHAEKQKVESLLQHKNTVFANITHEFKTPLTLISGPIEQLANDISAPEQSALIQMVRRNAQRLKLMVSQILKLSETELSNEANREIQAVQSTLNMLFEAFKPIASSKDIDMTLDNAAAVNVLVSPECLEIVISNLLSNAVKYTPVSGSIHISSQVSDELVSISIEDSGPGIKQQDQEAIFTRFVRLDAHRTIQGTGIGLSVVKEITEANGGAVHLNSEWGAGSTFTVTFPVTAGTIEHDMSAHLARQIVHNTQTELECETKPQNLPQQSGGQRITILVIEDNQDMQAHIGHVLSQRFNCLFANRGKAGIAMALEAMDWRTLLNIKLPQTHAFKYPISKDIKAPT